MFILRPPIPSFFVCGADRACIDYSLTQLTTPQITVVILHIFVQQQHCLHLLILDLKQFKPHQGINGVSEREKEDR